MLSSKNIYVLSFGLVHLVGSGANSNIQQSSKTFSEGDIRLYKLLTEVLDTLNITQLVTFVTHRYSENDFGSIE